MLRMSVLRGSHFQLPFLLPHLSSRAVARVFHTFGALPSPSGTHATHTPNKPLDIDPVLRALLNDTELSLARANAKSRAKRKNRDPSGSHSAFTPAPRRELEVLETTAGVENDVQNEDEDDVQGPFPRNERKSPAASFGSRGIGAVVLPFELQRSILRVISESDRPLIHADADRLFRDSPTLESDAEEAWSARYTPPSWSMKYSPPSYTEARSSSKISHIKARMNRQRDGTAFASVVMPAQYAVVRAVLEGVKTRLGNDWARGVERVVEWGSGTGAGMWAAMHTFQKEHPLPLSVTKEVAFNATLNKTEANASVTQSSPSNQELNPLLSDGQTPLDSDTASEIATNHLNDKYQIPHYSDDLSVKSTNIITYTAIEKREGLTAIARRLLRDVPLAASVSLQKTLHSSDRVPRASAVGLGTVALSAFMLNALGNPSLRRVMVKEMWDSGADVLVIIDDASAEGFRNVTDAREYLLKLGRREVEAVAHNHEQDITSQDPPETHNDTDLNDWRGKHGSHVIAPCPHDGACPLAFHQQLTSSPRRSSITAASSSFNGVRCTFTQRLQRPAFVRRTKHAGRGEEDVGYAYVVLRRGERVRDVSGGVVREGRVGAVGRWAEETAKAKEEEEEEERMRKTRWTIDEDGVEAGVVIEGESEAVRVEGREEASVLVDGLLDETVDETLKGEALEDVLRNEAYGWPRITFPPLKRSGHVLIDACMPEGNIMRMTFPRSQGKQIYYDARKSNWGDIFPHTPKHRPVLRYTGSKTNVSKPTFVKDRYKSTDGERLSKEEEMAFSRLTGWEEPRGKEKKEKRRLDVKMGGGRGGAGALANQSRAGWGSVLECLKAEDKMRQRERKLERRAKDASGDD